MANLPQVIRDAWEDRDGPVVLATVNKEGVPNAIYVGNLGIFEEDKFVVADNFFNKTRQNIHEGCKGALLFLDKKERSYQVKGSFEYHTNGEIYEQMKAINSPQLPGHAAAVLLVEEAYSGAERLC